MPKKSSKHKGLRSGISSKGGHARAKKMSEDQRKEVAKKGADARWKAVHEAEEIQPEFHVGLSDKSRSYWIALAKPDSELKVSLERASVLVLPWEGFGDHRSPVFPVGTEDFLVAMKRGLEPAVVVDICTTDEDYKELALHSETLRLATLIVTYAALPLVLNVLGNYVWAKLGGVKRGEVKSEIFVTKNDGTTMRLNYEGPANGFIKAVQSAPELLQNDSMKALSATSEETSREHK